MRGKEKEMDKKIILFSLLIFFFLLNNSIFAVGAEFKIEDIVNKQLAIENFQVDIELEILVYQGQNSKFLFTYFYQKPDKVHLETEDFVLLPKGAAETLQPNFFHPARFYHRYLGTKDEFHLFELTPKEEQKKYRLILWVDPEAKLLKQAEIFFTIENHREELAVQIDYGQIEGYSLPVFVRGKLAVPTKFGMYGEVKETQEGSFTLKLSNYKIDTVFPAAVRQKLTSPAP